MALVINSNIPSLNAQRNLNTSQSALSTSLQRLSSGLRINSAKDDAAGMAISSRMTAQINGLNQAARNANDGISLSQTAEGGISTASDLLQRMRELAVQAANGSNTSTDRASIQAEVAQLQQELNRVATTTQFNGQNILDGTLNNAQFQVGANANQVINFSIGSAQAKDIGNNSLSSSANTTALTEVKAGTANNLSTQTLKIQTNGLPQTLDVVAGDSAKKVADGVNALTATTGVTVTATTTVTLKGFVQGAASFTLQGTPNADGSPNAVTISGNLVATDGKDVGGLAAAINAQMGVTGISAIADLTLGTLTLTQAQGYDIGLVNKDVIQTAALMTGTKGDGSAGTGIPLGAVNNALTVGGRLEFSSPSSFSVSSSAADAGIFDGAVDKVNGSGLQSVANIDLTTMLNGTPTGANSAIAVIDGALANISSARAAMGALQNRFSATVTNLQTTAENLSSSRSRILDADFAQETANLSRAQILQQAGTAMLAQANSLPQNVLSLLK